MEKLQNAKLEGNHEALSNMGRKGARVAHSHRQQLEDLRTALESEDLAAQELARAQIESTSPDGDVLPPDQKIIESLH